MVEIQKSHILHKHEDFLEVKKQGRCAHFTVLDDGGAGDALTDEKIKSIISDSIDKGVFTFSGRSQTKEITIDGSHLIRVKMTPVVPLLHSIVTYIRKHILEPLFGKGSALTKHITKEFRAVVEKMPEKEQKKLLKDLRITPGEHYALAYFGPLIKNWPVEEKVNFITEVLRGAYVQIEDGGAFYDKWIHEVPHKAERKSSHESCAAQYSFQGPLFKECLFSKKKVVENGVEREVTWFQLERYPMGRMYTVPHILTWVLYKISGENQGPHGESAHTEKNNPIVLSTQVAN